MLLDGLRRGLAMMIIGELILFGFNVALMHTVNLTCVLLSSLGS